MEQDEQLMRGLCALPEPQRRAVCRRQCPPSRLRLIEVESADNNDGLPLVYSLEIISAYWGKRPRAVATRVVQSLSVAGGFISHLISDLINKKLQEVVVPKTYHKYTSRKCWSHNSCLIVDTGFFHADPHPVNMIRTPDGKLAILDFVGLVTKLSDDQKYGMIEAIVHLIHRDYDAIVKDFVKLGFIPEGVNNLDPILPVLAKVFDQALEGGGAKNINFQEFAADLAQAFENFIRAAKSDVKARAALAFLLSERGNFFREFILVEIVKAIDTVSREQLIQIATSFGEDRVILNNVEKVVKFLTSGTATPSVNGDVNMVSVVQELLPVLLGISSKILPDVLSRGS
ncbi:unnamed protein product [Urochloa decumbens]|uniref:ABC1 atypical kinase-like domain-containing protein n=1 Tax=Urochloa decumbens TaxID=240449 RepID=A0ABC9BWI5_9POAL